MKPEYFGRIFKLFRLKITLWSLVSAGYDVTIVLQNFHYSLPTSGLWMDRNLL